MSKSMTEVKLGFMTQAQILKILMEEHGYSQMAAIDAVDNELHEIWSKLTPGHTTTFSPYRLCCCGIENNAIGASRKAATMTKAAQTYIDEARDASREMLKSSPASHYYIMKIIICCVAALLEQLGTPRS